MSTDEERYKRLAAEHAADLIQPGMRLGLGTGSTANHLLRVLAERLQDRRLYDLVGVPTSEATATLATQLGIPLTTLHACPQLDLAIDGADEIDPDLNLIKGLGGALLREKIVAASATRFLIIGSSSKCVKRLGEQTPVPVECVAFAQPLVERRLHQLGIRPVLRIGKNQQPYVTDEGHWIIDGHLHGIDDPAWLGAQLLDIPGVVDHGLFIRMANQAVVAGAEGTRVLYDH